MPYSQLDPGKITATAQTLAQRVAERFPGRGLAQVCNELFETSSRQVARLDDISKPHLRLRALVTLVLLFGVTAIGFGVVQKVRLLNSNPGELYSFEGVEAIANMILLVGAGVWFLLNLEARIKRERALEALHELRSIAHVIDMHQLTKDPTSFVGPSQRTASSPERDLTSFELMRYLDYCAEMLSLTGKLAALYVQKLRDPVIIDTVNEIEHLTASFSQKIWQKIMIIRTEIDPAEAGSPKFKETLS
jgi:hypothetical protein